MPVWLAAVSLVALAAAAVFDANNHHNPNREAPPAVFVYLIAASAGLAFKIAQPFFTGSISIAGGEIILFLFLLFYALGAVLFPTTLGVGNIALGVASFFADRAYHVVAICEVLELVPTLHFAGLEIVCALLGASFVAHGLGIFD